MKRERLYRISNYLGASKTLLGDDDPIIKAKTGKEAATKFLKSAGIEYRDIKRSASNDVHILAEPFKYGEDGRMYKDGVNSWYQVTI